MKMLGPTPWMLLALFSLAGPVLAGCGGDTGGGGGGGRPAGLDAKVASTLTTDEKKVLCDYVAGLWGGYGKTKDCGGGVTVSGDTSQEDCLKDGAGKNCSAK